MWAVLAIIAFALALVFHIAGGSVNKFVLDAELAGLICLAVHFVWAVYPWRRPGPGPQ
jgi:hypothetical protein